MKQMKKLVLLSFLIFTTLFAFADFPQRPNPPRLVNDFANVLTQSQRVELENKLVQFARESSTQIVFISVSSLDGYDKVVYAHKIGQLWGVGQKDKDNGIIMLLKPKYKNSKGEIFIATGYGLEGVLPDVTAKIIVEKMIPYFKQNQYFEGINFGLDVVMDITRGEYTAEQYQESAQSEDSGIPFIVIVIIFFVVTSLIRGRSRRSYSPNSSLPWWITAFILNNNRGGGWNDFSSGGGSFGGGSGGFGGFGGGSFGGGGAGGSW